MGSSKQLTDKQRKFVQSYLASDDVKQSAINAGYSIKSSTEIGCQLMTNPKILLALDAARTKISSRLNSSTMTKDDYADRALKTFDALEITEPNSPRFFEIAGKAKGFIGVNNDSKPNQSINLTQINITGAESQPDLWSLTRKLLGDS